MNNTSLNDNAPAAGKPAPTIIFGNIAIDLSKIDFNNPDPVLMAQLDARLKKKDKNFDRAEKRRLMFNRSPRRKRK